MHTIRLKLVATVLGAVLLEAACANTATCGPGEALRNGLCLPAGGGQGGAQGMTTDAGTDGVARGECAANDPGPGTFGAKCTSDGDCACPAHICGIPPGATEGFCTNTCKGDPNACPSGWQCMDLSAINPDYPPTCLQSP